MFSRNLPLFFLSLILASITPILHGHAALAKIVETVPSFQNDKVKATMLEVSGLMSMSPPQLDVAIAKLDALDDYDKYSILSLIHI